MGYKKFPDAIFPSLSALLMALLIFTSKSYAQQEERTQQPQLTRDKSLFPLQSTGIWTEVHPLIPRVDYWGVDFLNADTGWAVGEGGAIIKTTNGGQKWIWYESGVENTLRTIAAVNNAQRLIAAGDGGIILISEDAGETWNTIPSGTTDNIWNLQMITNDIGWMVGEGGTALKTTDGGLTWIQQSTPYPNLAYWDVSFINTSFGYICCNSAIVLKTTNGGANWQIQQAGDTRSLFTIYAFDTLRASAGGFAGKIVYTTDGGNTWLDATGAYTEANKIKFIDDTLGFMAANGGFYESTNGGISWFSKHDLYMGSDSAPSTNLSFTEESIGYVTGTNMLLAKTIDKGESWKRTIVNADLFNVYFKDEQNGFINSANLFYTTNDGGQTLDTILTFPYNEIYSMEGMTFTDSLNGFIGTLPAKIYKTTNAGQNWYRTNITGLIDSSWVLIKFFFLTNDIAWAISNRRIMKTTDGGENWFVQLNAPGAGYFSSIYFVDSLYGWTSNLNRRPFKTTDGGSTWVEQTNLDFYRTNDVYFATRDTGWITNDYTGYDLYRTTNAGINWEVVNGLYNPRTFSFFPDTNHWWVYGYSNLYETTDRGVNWNNITPPLPLFSNFNALFNWVGYGVGSIGYITKYIDSSYVPVELFSFSSELSNEGVKLIWETATELNNKGFEVQKSLDSHNWTTIGFVEGVGNSTSINEYFFFDYEIIGNKAFYRFKQIDFNGSIEYSQVIEINLENFPIIFDLHQNYPNPFNPITTIKYDLPNAGDVSLIIYDILGRKVKQLVNEKQEAGRYEINFNASSLASGVYIYQLITDKYVNAKKMILLK